MELERPRASAVVQLPARPSPLPSHESRLLSSATPASIPLAATNTLDQWVAPAASPNYISDDEEETGTEPDNSSITISDDEEETVSVRRLPTN